MPAKRSSNNAAGVDARRAAVAPLLLQWYDAHRRDLPWRAKPGETPDPYRVWLSEVMLQQTTVATVRPRYQAWLARWPTLAALSAADEADVMAAWAGLGYYARARNLHRAARALVAEHGGVWPTTEGGLRALPGLGAYTAAAVAAIAFGRRAVVVDANVERVTARLFALADKRDVRAAADLITPAARAGDFAQAMMDLGSAICRPRAPQCLLCPLRDTCDGHASGDPEAFPAKKARKQKPRRYATAYVLLSPLPGREGLGVGGPSRNLRENRPAPDPSLPGRGEPFSSPSPSGEGLGWGRVALSVTQAQPHHRAALAPPPPPTPPLKGRGDESSSPRPPSRGPASSSLSPSESVSPDRVPGNEVAVLLIRRPPRGLLGNMRALPTGPLADTPPGLADPPFPAAWRLTQTTVSHAFTHFDLELALAVATAPAQSEPSEWWPLAEIEAAGLPTVFLKVALALRSMPCATS